jgi:hypothetical protein
MSGFNIHTGMPVFHGGATGHGFGTPNHMFGGASHFPLAMSGARPMHSLGGYLLGGAGVAIKGKKGFQKKTAVVAEDPATGEIVVLPQGVGSSRLKYKHKKPTISQRLRTDLGHLYRAEQIGAKEMRAVHPQLAKYLEHDALYTEGIYHQAKLPAYVRKQFGLTPSARAKKDAPYYFYVNKQGKQIFVKEGSAGMMRAVAKGFDVQPAEVQYYPPR